MNKDWIVDQLFKQIEELKMMTAGFKEMDHFPKAIIQLAKIKNKDIAEYLDYLQDAGSDQVSTDSISKPELIAVSEENRVTISEDILETISDENFESASVAEAVSEIDALLEEVQPAEETGNEVPEVIDPNSFEPQALEDNITLHSQVEAIEDNATWEEAVETVDTVEVEETKEMAVETVDTLDEKMQVEEDDLAEESEESEKEEVVVEVEEEEVELVSIDELLTDDETVAGEKALIVDASVLIQQLESAKTAESLNEETLHTKEEALNEATENNTQEISELETGAAVNGAPEKGAPEKGSVVNGSAENRTMNEVLGKDNNSLNTVIGNKKITDIRQAISIGDRFRYQRELFRSNGEDMNKTLSYINQLATYTEVLSFLKSKYNWTEDNETAEDFLQLVKRKF